MICLLISNRKNLVKMIAEALIDTIVHCQGDDDRGWRQHCLVPSAQLLGMIWTYPDTRSHGGARDKQLQLCCLKHAVHGFIKVIFTPFFIIIHLQGQVRKLRLIINGNKWVNKPARDKFIFIYLMYLSDDTNISCSQIHFITKFLAVMSPRMGVLVVILVK